MATIQFFRKLSYTQISSYYVFLHHFVKKNCENIFPVSSFDLDKPSKSRRFGNFSDKYLKKHCKSSCYIFADNTSVRTSEHIWMNSCRRRRLAGHLFQDRWEDQGRGFILLPPWPPNCLGQMLTVRDFSQHLVSSSKTIRLNIPRGARCMGHCEMM